MPLTSCVTLSKCLPSLCISFPIWKRDNVLMEGWYDKEIYVKHLEQCCQLINIEITE